MGSYNEEGTFLFRGKRLLPLHLPINQTQKLLEQYNGSDKTLYIYDPLVGWTYREHHTSEYYGDMYQHTNSGIRTGSKDVKIVTQSTQLRLALFGDSFTHGDDVKFEESWGYLLEQKLKQNGFDVEVLNFGLGGGAMDQAYLRWKHYGKNFKPDIVIFGFQEENRERNVSIIRTVHHINNGLPFSKPRFILESGGLKLINSPTLSPEETLEVMKHINEWNLVKYENYYQPEYYKNYFWLKSKLAALIYTELRWAAIEYEIDKGLNARMTEQNNLAFEIIQLFKKEAEEDGSEFLVVHLPNKGSIETFEQGSSNYQELLNKISTKTDVIKSKAIYNEFKKGTNLFIPHFSPLANQIIADDIANYLKPKLAESQLINAAL